MKTLSLEEEYANFLAENTTGRSSLDEEYKSFLEEINSNGSDPDTIQRDHELFEIPGLDSIKQPARPVTESTPTREGNNAPIDLSGVPFLFRMPVEADMVAVQDIDRGACGETRGSQKTPAVFLCRYRRIFS